MLMHACIIFGLSTSTGVRALVVFLMAVVVDVVEGVERRSGGSGGAPTAGCRWRCAEFVRHSIAEPARAGHPRDNFRSRQVDGRQRGRYRGGGARRHARRQARRQTRRRGGRRGRRVRCGGWHWHWQRSIEDPVMQKCAKGVVICQSRPRHRCGASPGTDQIHAQGNDEGLSLRQNDHVLRQVPGCYPSVLVHAQNWWGRDA
mmetsp:Transcript_62626/g.177065  ORF Transcript_62626/g.177065 Transcript_62626/m.177065 type:complete len:202 (+) Transcript_62626:739-1344(+)